MNIYSSAGSQQFNTFLDTTLHALGKEIEQAMGEPFLALILAGGYGRGEGACIQKDGKEAPYNDFDLFVVVRERIAISEKVLEITKKYEEKLGIEVDIGKPLTIDMIRGLPHQLMYQDLLQSHKVIVGDPQILSEHAPSYLRESLPQIEALRLLLNRGSGLLQAIIHCQAGIQYAKHVLPDPDFIRRNREKCTLALGDSLLITHRLYTPPLDQRTKTLHEQIEGLPIPQAQRILSLYEQAAHFKTHPDSLTKEQPPLSDLQEIAQLWVEVMLYCERARTGKVWNHAGAYERDHFIREPEQHTPKNLLRNLGKNLKEGRISLLYPREKLYGKLGVLLGNPKPEENAWRKQAETFLGAWNGCN
ncbi:MAG: hypothetical protein JEY71_00750 [Sphaerochaeta sp.]|nr:hypothetical protein [Sphaerochaeta sp.]